MTVKVLHGRWNRDRSRIERFRRGATKLGQLHDVPGVVDLVSEPTADEQWHFFAMEYLDGGDLQSAVLRPEPLPTAGALGAVLTAAEALGEAHRRGMVHRDVKPSNILLDGRGRAKLGDFDLVLAGDTTGGTGTGPLGTVLYAAPELFDRPADAGPAADVYGLAMSAVFVLHGQELPRSMIRRPGPVLNSLPVSPTTGAQYRRLVGARRGRWDPDCPVTAVSWLMAVRYCNALSRREGLAPAYLVDGQAVTRQSGADGYRLPTEAEWEYACRAGTTTRYWCGDDERRLAEVALCVSNGRRSAEPSGERAANPWGLFDMHGNVWEWCHDAMGLYGDGPAVDPFGPDRGARRVVRGGAYNARAVDLRSASRAGRRATETADDVGFRVVRPAR